MGETVEETARHEMTMLRQELHNLKTCQFAFLTTAFTSCGLILGLFPEIGKNALSVYGCLVPLVVVLPAFCFFFDKARTITRIVGYYRLLEECVAGEGFPAWENALALSRKTITTGLRKNAFLKGILTQQPFGYWSLAYYTFLGLSAVSLAGAIRLHGVDNLLPADVLTMSFRSGVVFGAGLLVVYSAIRNAYIFWCITIGKNSYDRNCEQWRLTLRHLTLPHLVGVSGQDELPAKSANKVSKVVNGVSGDMTGGQAMNDEGKAKGIVNGLHCYSLEELHEGFKYQRDEYGWDFNKEREFMEKLFCQRFNFLLIIYSIFITAAANAQKQQTLTLILVLGAILTALVSLTIGRAYVKLDINLKILHKMPKHPFEFIQNETNKLGCRGLFAVNAIIGKWVPLFCTLSMIMGAVCSWLGYLAIGRN